MTKTTNYQLNQWDATDRVLRTDFNSDNQKIEEALEALQGEKGNCDIASGSYTGTGAYGATAANTLTFSFQPKLLCLAEKNATFGSCYALLLQGQTAFCYFTSNGGGNSGVCTWNENSVTWYSQQNAACQFNTPGTQYCYIAIG